MYYVLALQESLIWDTKACPLFGGYFYCVHYLEVISIVSFIRGSTVLVLALNKFMRFGSKKTHKLIILKEKNVIGQSYPTQKS